MSPFSFLIISDSLKSVGISAGEAGKTISESGFR
jgi:hypothetical protein